MANSPVLRVTGTDNGSGIFLNSIRTYKTSNIPPSAPDEDQQTGGGWFSADELVSQSVSQLRFDPQDLDGLDFPSVSAGDILEMGRARFVVVSIVSPLLFNVQWITGEERYEVDTVYVFERYVSTGVSVSYLDNALESRDKLIKALSKRLSKLEKCT